MFKEEIDMINEFKALIAQYSEISEDEMTDDMRFREDLGFTSLGFMSFLGDLEDTFDVELDQDEALQVRTVGEAIEMMNNLVEA